MNVKDIILGLLKDEALAARDDLQAAAEQVAEFAAEQAELLADLVGEDGFDEAVKASRDNILMRSGLTLVAEADASDARFVGILQGALTVAAHLI